MNEISRLDYFAGLAMQAILASKGWSSTTTGAPDGMKVIAKQGEIAVNARLMAEAMCDELDKDNG